MKRIALIVAAASAFLVGYGFAGHAWPGVPDRDKWHGYFQNKLDTQGDQVIPGGFPSSVDTATEFINFVKNKYSSGTAREKVGAGFIIQTMLGNPTTGYDHTMPSADEVTDWESRIRHYDTQNRIQWKANFTYSGNSYWQGNNDGGPDPNDDAYYYENGTRLSIIFLNAAKNDADYVLKRDCGNPLTFGSMPGVEDSYTITGNTTVAGTAQPGQTVNFEHFLHNIVGGTTPRITWTTYEGASSAGTGLPPKTGSVLMPSGANTNVVDESFTVPINAAAGTKYCREVGYDPRNSSGGRNGRGAEACVTVTIPAKLKASMTVSPSTMQPGDTATFTPSLSATSNASPITVNCSINRTSYAPSGAATSLGAVPCVTTAGDPNIVIGTGASVILRANNYTAADTLPIGSRICDLITITNPSDPGFYADPGDRTDEKCVAIAKVPYVQFMGGDVWAGGGFAAVAPGTCNNGAKITTKVRTRALTADGTTPGSGVTYGAFALGKITDFGSASMALVSASGIGDNWTFSNINPGNLGFYGAPQHCIPDYVSTYMSAPALAPGVINVASGGSGSWKITGDATIHGTMPAGEQKVFLVVGNVTIDSDIRYIPNYGGVAQIPSVVVIATGNIYINAGVQQVDGIYIARGTTYTCYPKVEPATIATCANKLTINGSVSTNALDLFRTAGADGGTPASQKSAAETFNLSSEVFITNALNQTNRATITTTNVRELPPRF